MQLGWVNFSKKDKRNAISIIHALNDKGVLDELGFGVLRDAFANEFFPGTSTLHTRPKYLYLISYLLYEYQQKCANEKKYFKSNELEFINNLWKKIDYDEWQIKKKLKDEWNGKKLKGNEDVTERIIGSLGDSYDDWVERTPIVIYWTALRTYDFIRTPKTLHPISYNDYLSLLYAISYDKEKARNTATVKGSDVKNDDCISEEIFFPVAEGLYTSNWRENISIELTKTEATDLRRRIVEGESSKNSLLAIVLENNLLPNSFEEMSFEQFVEVIKPKKCVPQDIKNKLELACKLNDFYYIVLLRYYFLLDNKKYEEIWADEEKNIKKICKAFDPDDIFCKMNIKNKGSLLTFLKSIKKALKNKNYAEVDELITVRETEVKPGREKIRHKERYNEDDLKIINELKFDYRFFVAKRYVQDIQKGLNKKC